jgi:23S rRNA pseudouridine1911/1915/1917 synthase
MPQTFPITFDATSDDTGKRLDQFLVASIPDVSRARVQQLIEQDQVRVNGVAAKPSLKLKGGECIEVLGPAEVAPLRAVPEEIELDIVYEDDDLAVVNKPAGMMVHAGAGATEDARNRGTLVNALLHRFAALSGVGGELRPGIVHRLDRNTSGLILVAKNDLAHRKLGEQFSSRRVKKTYLTLVHGWPKKPSATIDAPISRDALRRTRMTTRRSEGREAISHYKVLEKFESPYGKFALLEVRIDTGRTHQIRVHLSSIGHPVVGDTLYGAPREITFLSSKRPTSAKGSQMWGTLSVLESAGGVLAAKTESEALSLPRNFLHAAAISFFHPRTGAPLAFARPLPADLEKFLSSLLSRPPR